MKAKIDRDGKKSEIEGKNLIDIVEQVMMSGDKSKVTTVEIERSPEEWVVKPDEA